MGNKVKLLVKLILLSTIPTLLLWLPFALKLESFWGIPLPKDGMATVVANYDGPLFIVVAKTLYNVEQIKNLVSFALPAEYYAAHFPLFPILIRVFSPLLGYPYAMISVTLLSSILATYFFYLYARGKTNAQNALWLTLIFSILPARWLIVKSVGSSEPLFMAATIASIYYFDKKKFLASGIWGALAQLTRSIGGLLFVAYALYIIYTGFRNLATINTKQIFKGFNVKKYFGLLLIPLALLLLFCFYKIQYNDFYAYFNSGDNIHLFFPPFQVFNYSASWVGTFWLEEIIFVYILAFMGLTKLIKKEGGIASWYTGLFFLVLIFISHRDIVRYALPVVPFLLVGWSDTLNTKEFKWLTLALIIPIYLFSLAFISQNVMPISDWAGLL